MSTTTNNVAELDKALNEAILSGKAMEAFEQYYADDVVMQENSEAPRVGKDANRKAELEFFSPPGSVSRRQGGFERRERRCDVRGVVSQM